jgi:hypothetical protein
MLHSPFQSTLRAHVTGGPFDIAARPPTYTQYVFSFVTCIILLTHHSQSFSMHRELIACTVASQDGYIHAAQIERTAVQYEVVVGKQRRRLFVFHTHTIVSHYRRPGEQGRHSRMNRRRRVGAFARQGMVLLLSSTSRDSNRFPQGVLCL